MLSTSQTETKKEHEITKEEIILHVSVTRHMETIKMTSLTKPIESRKLPEDIVDEGNSQNAGKQAMNPQFKDLTPKTSSKSKGGKLPAESMTHSAAVRSKVRPRQLPNLSETFLTPIQEKKRSSKDLDQSLLEPNQRLQTPLASSSATASYSKLSTSSSTLSDDSCLDEVTLQEEIHEKSSKDIMRSRQHQRSQVGKEYFKKHQTSRSSPLGNERSESGEKHMRKQPSKDNFSSEVSKSLYAEETKELQKIYRSNYCEKVTSTLYKARHQSVFEDTQNLLRKVEVGPKYLSRTDEKTIMLLGATGSGKTRLINAMFNYILGVKWEDRHRYKLIDEKVLHSEAKSQTKAITAYTIHHQPWFTIPYSLTIIDTPGFGDTEGIARDKTITEQIRTFFKRRGISGIDSLDAVGFVIQSNLPRLTQPQQYIFDSILTIFGEDIKENIFMFLTWADGHGNPAVLAAIEEAKLPCKKHFVFNNGSDLHEHSKAEETFLNCASVNFEEIYWNLGADNFKSFIKEIGMSEPKSLALTKKVLRLRYRLQKALYNIQRSVKLGLTTLDELRKEKEVLQHHKKDIEKNRRFEYEAIEQYVMCELANPGITVINCKKCNVTCYEAALEGRDIDDFLKVFIGVSCPVCPRRCRRRHHREQQHSLVFKKRTVNKSSDDLQKKYEDALGKERNTKQAIEECSRRIEEVEGETLRFLKQARAYHASLCEIALKPQNWSIEDYIELQIEVEKAKDKEGLSERLKPLIRLQELCRLEENVLQKNFDPEQYLKAGDPESGDPIAEGYNMTHVVEPLGPEEKKSKSFFGKVKKLFKIKRK